MGDLVEKYLRRVAREREDKEEKSELEEILDYSRFPSLDPSRTHLPGEERRWAFWAGKFWGQQDTGGGGALAALGQGRALETREKAEKDRQQRVYESLPPGFQERVDESTLGTPEGKNALFQARAEYVRGPEPPPSEIRKLPLSQKVRQGKSVDLVDMYSDAFSGQAPLRDEVPQEYLTWEERERERDVTVLDKWVKARQEAGKLPSPHTTAQLAGIIAPGLSDDILSKEELELLNIKFRRSDGIFFPTEEIDDTALRIIGRAFEKSESMRWLFGLVFPDLARGSPEVRKAHPFLDEGAMGEARKFAEAKSGLDSAIDVAVPLITELSLTAGIGSAKFGVGLYKQLDNVYDVTNNAWKVGGGFRAGKAAWAKRNITKTLVDIGFAETEVLLIEEEGFWERGFTDNMIHYGILGGASTAFRGAGGLISLGLKGTAKGLPAVSRYAKTQMERLSGKYGTGSTEKSLAELGRMSDEGREAVDRVTEVTDRAHVDISGRREEAPILGPRRLAPELEEVDEVFATPFGDMGPNNYFRERTSEVWDGDSQVVRAALVRFKSLVELPGQAGAKFKRLFIEKYGLDERDIDTIVDNVIPELDSKLSIRNVRFKRGGDRAISDVVDKIRTTIKNDEKDLYDVGKAVVELSLSTDDKDLLALWDLARMQQELYGGVRGFDDKTMSKAVTDWLTDQAEKGVVELPGGWFDRIQSKAERKILFTRMKQEIAAMSGALGLSPKKQRELAKALEGALRTKADVDKVFESLEIEGNKDSLYQFVWGVSQAIDTSNARDFIHRWANLTDDDIPAWLLSGGKLSTVSRLANEHENLDDAISALVDYSKKQGENLRPSQAKKLALSAKWSKPTRDPAGRMSRRGLGQMTDTDELALERNDILSEAKTTGDSDIGRRSIKEYGSDGHQSVNAPESAIESKTTSKHKIELTREVSQEELREWTLKHPIFGKSEVLRLALDSMETRGYDKVDLKELFEGLFIFGKGTEGSRTRKGNRTLDAIARRISTEVEYTLDDLIVEMHQYSDYFVGRAMPNPHNYPAEYRAWAKMAAIQKGEVLAEILNSLNQSKIAGNSDAIKRYLDEWEGLGLPTYTSFELKALGKNPLSGMDPRYFGFVEFFKAQPGKSSGRLYHNYNRWVEAGKPGADTAIDLRGLKIGPVERASDLVGGLSLGPPGLTTRPDLREGVAAARLTREFFVKYPGINPMNLISRAVGATYPTTGYSKAFKSSFRKWYTQGLLTSAKTIEFVLLANAQLSTLVAAAASLSRTLAPTKLGGGADVIPEILKSWISGATPDFAQVLRGIGRVERLKDSKNWRQHLSRARRDPSSALGQQLRHRDVDMESLGAALEKASVTNVEMIRKAWWADRVPRIDAMMDVMDLTYQERRALDGYFSMNQWRDMVRGAYISTTEAVRPLSFMTDEMIASGKVRYRAVIGELEEEPRYYTKTKREGMLDLWADRVTKGATRKIRETRLDPDTKKTWWRGPTPIGVMRVADAFFTYAFMRGERAAYNANRVKRDLVGTGPKNAAEELEEIAQVDAISIKRASEVQMMRDLGIWARYFKDKINSLSLFGTIIHPFYTAILSYAKESYDQTVGGIVAGGRLFAKSETGQLITPRRLPFLGNLLVPEGAKRVGMKARIPEEFERLITEKGYELDVDVIGKGLLEKEKGGVGSTFFETVSRPRKIALLLDKRGGEGLSEKMTVTDRITGRKRSYSANPESKPNRVIIDRGFLESLTDKDLDKLAKKEKVLGFYTTMVDSLVYADEATSKVVVRRSNLVHEDAYKALYGATWLSIGAAVWWGYSRGVFRNADLSPDETTVAGQAAPWAEIGTGKSPLSLAINGGVNLPMLYLKAFGKVFDINRLGMFSPLVYMATYQQALARIMHEDAEKGLEHDRANLEELADADSRAKQEANYLAQREILEMSKNIVHRDGETLYDHLKAMEASDAASVFAYFASSMMNDIGVDGSLQLLNELKAMLSGEGSKAQRGEEALARRIATVIQPFTVIADIGGVESEWRWVRKEEPEVSQFYDTVFYQLRGRVGLYTKHRNLYRRHIGIFGSPTIDRRTKQGLATTLLSFAGGFEVEEIDERRKNEAYIASELKRLGYGEKIKGPPSVTQKMKERLNDTQLSDIQEQVEIVRGSWQYVLLKQLFFSEPGKEALKELKDSSSQQAYDYQLRERIDSIRKKANTDSAKMVTFHLYNQALNGEELDLRTLGKGKWYGEGELEALENLELSAEDLGPGSRPVEMLRPTEQKVPGLDLFMMAPPEGGDEELKN